MRDPSSLHCRTDDDLIVAKHRFQTQHIKLPAKTPKRTLRRAEKT